MNLAGLWDQLVDAVCRPPRDDQYTEADLVGGRRASFRLYQRKYYRQDVTLQNSRGQNLQCSHYRPCVVTSADGRLPCAIYCHCNSGSRRDAEEILYHLLPKGITVFAFDFAGSGLSEGSYVTLGAFEVDDLAAVVHYLREEGSTSTIGLWGRSMGAVTALLYSQQDPSVGGMVLDSPFSRLVDLMMELATDQQLRIPKPLIKMALAMLKRSVRKRAGFRVEKVAPLDYVGQSFIPALFGHASDDTFVNKHHSERLFQAYSGEKNFVSFSGDHNSVRPNFWYDTSVIFMMQALRVAELVGEELDLQSLPEEQLPHLHARNSIYVTAAKALAEEESDEEEQGAIESAAAGAATAAAASGAEAARRPHSPMQRQLSPPWRMASPHASADGGREQQDGSVDTSAVWSLHPLGQALVGGRQGQGQGSPRSGDDEDEEGLVYMTEEEALQHALELSLQEARQQQEQHAAGAGEAGAGSGASPPAGAGGEEQQQPGHAQQPAAAGVGAAGAGAVSALGTRYNPMYSSNGGEGRQRNPLFASSSTGDIPHSMDEEEQMLAAAIAESLQEQLQGAQQPQQAADVAVPATAGAASAPAASEQPQAVGQAGAAAPDARAAGGDAVAASALVQQESGTAAVQAGGKGKGAQKQQEEAAEEEVSMQRASSLEAQRAADLHSGQEAAAVRASSAQLQHTLGDAMDALLQGAGSWR